MDRRLALGAMVVLVLAGCTTAQSGPPGASAGQPLASTARSAPPPASPAEPLPSSASSTPPPAPAATPLPSAVEPAPLPSRDWTSIHWAASGAPDSPPPGPKVDRSFYLFGWSGGYVTFRWHAKPDVSPNFGIATSFSRDGVHWYAGGDLEMPANVPDKLARSYGPETISEVVDGPAGLLAAAAVPAGSCGWATDNAFWLSTDGRSWQPLSGVPNGVTRLAAGGAGYVAADLNAGRVWTSTNARNWIRADFSTAGAGIGVQGIAAFGRGFLVSGAMTEPMCGIEPVKTAAVLYSADGTTWTRSSLPGAPLTSEVETWVHRINDGAVLLVTETFDASHMATSLVTWTSTDGRIWVPSDAGSFPRTTPITDGRRGMLVHLGAKVAPVIFDRALTLRPLTESGDYPGNTAFGALGPAGILVADEPGSYLWLGTPESH